VQKGEANDTHRVEKAAGAISDGCRQLPGRLICHCIESYLYILISSESASATALACYGTLRSRKSTRVFGPFELKSDFTLIGRILCLHNR
jgi:hypothetical protein